MTRTYHRMIAGLAAAELPVVILIAPALLFPSPARLLVLLVIPLVWLSNRRVSGHLIPPTPLNAALFVMLGMVGVSLVATFDVSFSLGKVSGVVLGVLVFWAVSRWLTTTTRQQIATVVFLLTGCGLAALGLLGAPMPTSNVYKYPALGIVMRALPKLFHGLPGAEDGFNPNAVSGCLVLFLPLQIALVGRDVHRWACPRATRRWPTRVLLFAIQLLLLLLTAGAILLMQSRGAWIALAAGGVVFVLLYGRWTRALFALGTMACAAFALGHGLEGLSKLALTALGPGMSSTAVARVKLWATAVDLTREFPLTGIGMNMFRRLASPGVDVVHAHNHLLQAALDLGVPGLIAYGATWIITAGLLVHVYRLSAEPIAKAMVVGLGSGLAAHFVFGMSDTIALGAKAGVVFWLTLALVVGLHRVTILRVTDGQ